jgi:ubiquinone/menaquinone biosynthesis C-methylase UbiE
MGNYIHGYTEREKVRLQEQSEILEQLLHADTNYEAYSSILEAGCGIGAQTVILAKRNPETFITSIDISEDSLNYAQNSVVEAGIKNVKFRKADIFDLPFSERTFDHVFVCFILEHLDRPLDALLRLNKVLKPGGSITLIEGIHAPCYWNPYTEASHKAWNAMIKAQQLLNHDPNIGIRLYPLLVEAGFKVEWTEPRYVYADGNSPSLLNGVINKIIVPMAKTATESAITNKLIDKNTWEKGLEDLEKAAIPPSGTFFYSWVKALARK